MIRFDPDTHRYWLDGTEFPAVTTVLDRLGLIPPYPDVKFYRARGKAVHKACELFDHGELGTLDDRLTGWVASWRAFLNDSDFTPRLIEHRVASTQFQYCGTIDRIGLLQGAMTVLDIKCGAVAAATALQTAAYKRAYLEHDGVCALRRLAVQLMENGRYKVTEYQEHSEDERRWLSALDLYRWKERNHL